MPLTWLGESALSPSALLSTGFYLALRAYLLDHISSRGTRAGSSFASDLGERDDSPLKSHRITLMEN